MEAVQQHPSQQYFTQANTIFRFIDKETRNSIKARQERNKERNSRPHAYAGLLKFITHLSQKKLPCFKTSCLGSAELRLVEAFIVILTNSLLKFLY